MQTMTLMQRLELSVVMLAILTALAASGLWLWTEYAHHRAAVLVERVLTGKPLDAADLRAALSDLPSPSMQILPGKHLFHAGTLAVAAADHPDLSETVRLQWIKRAKDSLPDALAREPAHAHAWTHLAYTAWLLDGPNPTSVNALRMSIYASPGDAQLILWRLKLADANRAFWDSGFQDLIGRQATLAWHRDPRSLAKFAVSQDLIPLISESLSHDPEEQSRFERLATKRRSNK